MNITILDDTISSIPYISQVSSTSSIADQFTMDTLQNIYVVAIDNEEPAIATTAVQLLQDKQKCVRSSSVMTTIDWQRPYVITYFEEHRALFDQGCPILEPDLHHHEVFSTNNPDKPSNFGHGNWLLCS